MISVSTRYAAVDKKVNNPVYRATVSGTEYASGPIKANYFDEIYSDGPGGYWRFGEQITSPPTTAAVDSSGNGLNGVYHGSPTLAVTGTIVQEAATAVALNGTTQYISVASNASIDPADVMSACGWFKTTGFAAQQVLMDKGANAFKIYLFTDSKLYFAKSGGVDIAKTSITLSANTWYFFSVTKNGSTVHIYINAVDVTSSINSATLATNGVALGIGATSGGGANFFGGTIEEFAIFSRDLSPARVQAEYDTGLMLFNRSGVLPYMLLSPSSQLPSISAAQLIAERGQSSSGDLAFGLIDVGDYDSEVLVDSPNLYLKLNELKGTIAVDSSGQSLSSVYNGTLQLGQPGPCQYVETPDWAVGLNGSSSRYVSTPDDSRIDMSDIGSIEFWINPTSFPFPTRVIVDKGANGYQVVANFSGTILFIKSGGVTIAESNSGISQGSWSHVVITKNGSDTHIYINGVDVTVLDTNATIAATAIELRIGKSGVPGSMARFAFYQTVLSADRVRAHYNAMIGRNAYSQNGAATRLVAADPSNSVVTFSMGFASIREADYIQMPIGIIDDFGLTQDLTGYQFTVRDPQTLTNKQLFNVVSTRLTVAMNDTDVTAIVADASAFNIPGYVRIDSEIMSYTGTTSGTQIGENTWSSIAYGAGLYVAVSADGYVALSADGSSWASILAAEPNPWTSIVWSPGLSLFVAVASSGTNRVMTSPDGIVWTLHAGIARTWQSIAWSPSLGLLAAVAPGVTTSVMVSSDGSAWTEYAMGSDLANYIAGGDLTKAITWSPDLGMFSAGNIYSTDGTHWKQIGPIPQFHWWSVCYDSTDGKLVAVSNELGASQYANGNSDLDWSASDSVSLTRARSVCWSSDLNLFVTVANVSGISTNAVASSPDGTTWTPRRTSTTQQSFRCVIWVSSLTKFVAVGANSTVESVITSPDGINWTDRATSHGQTYESVAYSPSLGRLCAVASGTSGAGTMVMTSSDAIAWAERTESESNRWMSVCWADTLSLFVAVASSGTHRVMTSPNGIAWTNATAAEANSWQSVCWSNALGKLVAVSTDGTHRVMYSSDGATWHTAVSSAQNTWRTVIWVSSLSKFVALSEDGTYPVMYSTDGITWSASIRLPIATWTGIQWASSLSKFVAVLSDAATNQVWTSVDGKTWLPQSQAETNSWEDLAWSSSLSLLVAVAQAGANQVMYSSDGIAWNTAGATAANQWQAVTFANGLFVAVANSGSGTRSMQSSDGTTWLTSYSSLTGLVRGLLGTTAASHSVGVTVQELIILGPLHPIDILLGVLENTDKTGLGISVSLIDTVGLAALKTLIGSSYRMRFIISSPVNVQSWIQSEICQPLGLYPVTSSGKYSMHEVQVISAAVDTITADDIAVVNNVPQITWEKNFKSSIINSVTWLYDFDVVSSSYASSITYTDAASIAAHGTYPLIIKSAGLNSQYGGTKMLIATVANTLLTRYARGAPRVTVRALLSKNIDEPGDTVAVTSLFLPTSSPSARGIVAAQMEVMSRAMNLYEGTVDLVLLWFGWN